ncbi:hypothetical protein ElyMa_001874500 [Elysia marginata]|uniref:Uncharacterized protein n=1 Tax=Elysia marginata TaxID=1093978 RepID=A0AAV4EN36_9GAST|nr:hypothetical protein ElyMa_001874500 [Elysia marginata]
MKVRIEEERRGGGVATVPLSLSPQTNAHSDAPQTNAHRDALDKRSQSHPEDRSPVDSATAGRKKKAINPPAPSVALGSRHTSIMSSDANDLLYNSASSEVFDFVENAKEDCGPDVDTKLAQVVNNTEKLPMHKLSSIEERNIMAGNVDVGVPKTNIEIWKQLGRSV